MKLLIYPLIFLVSLTICAQEDEFMATFIGDKEAFLSSKTGEFVFRAHDKTDASALQTTESGVVIYTDKKIHTVKKGETLSAVAKKYDISVSELKKQNKISKANLRIGQELKIEKKLVVNSSKPVINQAEGKIIARLAPGQMPGNMTPPDLPPDAMPGNTINLVVDDAEPKTAPIVEKNVEAITEDLNEDGTLTHTVKSGETLFSIARKYKISIQDLKATNNLALNTLSTGQKLKIKVYNPEVFNQSQQTRSAKQQNTDHKHQNTKEVTKEVEDIKVAQEAEKPQKEIIEVKKTETVKALKEKEAKKEELIEDVKVPEKIVTDVKTPKKTQAKKEGQIDELIKKYAKKDSKEKANIKDNSAEEPTLYTVKAGDTLYAIAKTHNTTVQEIKRLNKLSNNDLSIGQKLKLK